MNATDPLPPPSEVRFDITPAVIRKELETLTGTPVDDAFRFLRFEQVDGATQQIGLPGATGDVYVAKNRRGDPVAVKVFRDENYQRVQASVEKEWRASQVDCGPRVARAHAAYLVRRKRGRLRWLIVMDLVPGDTLAAVMDGVKSGTAVPFGTQERWVRAGLEGLKALAEQRHELLDIKPENIGLNGSDYSTALPVFLDHGAARRNGTEVFVHIGTTRYAAPEHWGMGAETPKADIYSFGAAVLNTFTGGEGVEPGVADTGVSFFGRPRLDDERVSPAVARVLRGALVKDPLLRPDIEDLLSALDDPTDESYLGWDPYSSYTPDSATAQRGDPSPTYTSRGDESRGNRSLGPLEGRPSAVRVSSSTTKRATPVRLLPLEEDLAELEHAPRQPRLRGRQLERFAGVDPRYVTTRSNRTVYNIVGTMLVLYAAYCTLVVATLITRILGDGFLPWAVGLLVGGAVATMVIGLDRSIMAMSNVNLDDIDDPEKDQYPFRRGARAMLVLRVAFAILFAIVVGETAIQVVLDKDITAYMASTHDVSLEEASAEIKTGYQAEIDNQNAKIATAEQAMVDYQAQIADAEARSAGEADGTYGTRVAQCGEKCLQYQAEADGLIAGRGVFDATQNSKILEARNAIDDINTDIAADIEAAETEIGNDNGAFAREHALWEMMLADPSMLARYFVLALLLLFFELTAVIIKLATKGNNYERTHARALRHRERVDRMRHAALRSLATRRAKENEKLLSNADRSYYTGPEARDGRWGRNGT